MKFKVLIIEDDPTFRLMLKKWFERNEFNALPCSTILDAKKLLGKSNFDLVMTDLRLPDGEGTSLLAWLKEQDISTPVIVMTSYGEIQSAVSSIKSGAFDYMEKPINPSILKSKVEEALKQNQQTKVVSVNENKNIQNSDTQSPQVILGNSPGANEMYEHIALVAPTNLSVMIRGESGTGKEHTARMIHEKSNRNKAPFIAVDCGSLSKELAPSELFGHVKGSFTSAMTDKKGIFEQAAGGTIFLDEVGNLSYDVQIQLLRALQELKVRPVGSVKDISIDVRIITATNEDLEQAIAEGRFREDLFHRLNEFTLTVPPLRERGDDIVLFSNHFLQEANKEFSKNVKELNPDIVLKFKAYPWPGNLRELRNVIRRAVLLSKDNKLAQEALPDCIVQATKEIDAPSIDLYTNATNEKEQIIKALQLAKGNKTQAAKLLKIDRKTLYNKIHLLGIGL